MWCGVHVCMCASLPLCVCIPFTGVRLQHVSSELHQPLSGQLDLVQFIAETLVLRVILGGVCLAQTFKGELQMQQRENTCLRICTQGVAKPFGNLVQKTYTVNG